MTHPTDIDAGLVKKLADLLDETRLTEIEYAVGDLRIRVTRQPAALHVAAPSAATQPVVAATSQPAAEGPAPEDLSKHPGAVRSPMVGTVYLSPQPGAPPFVRAGDTVSMGQTLLIIEAMKVMNPIKAPKGGTIAQVVAEDTKPVEFGETLVVIE